MSFRPNPNQNIKIHLGMDDGISRELEASVCYLMLHLSTVMEMGCSDLGCCGRHAFRNCHGFRWALSLLGYVRRVCALFFAAVAVGFCVSVGRLMPDGSEGKHLACHRVCGSKRMCLGGLYAAVCWG